MVSRDLNQDLASFECGHFGGGAGRGWVGFGRPAGRDEEAVTIRGERPLGVAPSSLGCPLRAMGVVAYGDGTLERLVWGGERPK